MEVKLVLKLIILVMHALLCYINVSTYFIWMQCDTSKSEIISITFRHSNVLDFSFVLSLEFNENIMLDEK